MLNRKELFCFISVLVSCIFAQDPTQCAARIPVSGYTCLFEANSKYLYIFIYLFRKTRHILKTEVFIICNLHSCNNELEMDFINMNVMIILFYVEIS